METSEEENIVDFKRDEQYLPQYVDLRNRYVDLLLTSPVNIDGTKKWMRETDVEMRGIVVNETLCGAVILYLSKEGEVTFFVREPNKGFGSRLLNVADMVARERGLEKVWAWVLDNNRIAQRAFEKNGYHREGVTIRNHEGREFRGVIYKKSLRQW